MTSPNLTPSPGTTTADTVAHVFAPVRELLQTGCFGGPVEVDPYALNDALHAAEDRLADVLNGTDTTT